MRRQGGKGRVRKPFADLLGRAVELGGFKRIEDRCCGSLAVSRGLFERVPSIQITAAVDLCPALIACLQAVKGGWDPRPRCQDSTSQVRRVTTSPLCASE